MASIIKVDRILDSTELGKVDIPGGIETDVLNATELVANTWKNVDGTENYKCRAWVNFDGTTTPPTILASGNVSSVVRNGTGDYTVNFETAMPDENYSVGFCVTNTITATNPVQPSIASAGSSGDPYLMTTTQIRIVHPANGSGINNKRATYSFFR